MTPDTTQPLGYSTTVMPIRRLRRSPHASNLNQWLTHHRLQIDVNAGNSQPGAGVPVLMEQHSDDGGYTYGRERQMACGAAGAYSTQAYLNKLGRSRDRIYQIVDSDPTPRVLLNAMIDAAP